MRSRTDATSSCSAPSGMLDRPTLALVGVTAIWGSTFVVVKRAVEQIPVADFLAWRFAIAAVAMLLLRPRSVASLGTAGRRSGVLVGLALGAGYLLQTVGLQHTSAAISGFITGMFVVLTPLVAFVLLRQRVSWIAGAAVVLATGGLALLSLHGSSIGYGELLTLGCALAFALHIVGLGRWAPSYDAYGLAVVQLLTTAVLCLAFAAPGGVAVPRSWDVWGALALTALAATALAFVVQTWAQASLAPT
ncbi:MAG: Threonine/homoserine efflux transporter RhtA, partial [Frankiales bacterium]|nr:Threonine/homoserine efflux transporter RhtA [Frankiales bacterium]